MADKSRGGPCPPGGNRSTERCPAVPRWQGHGQEQIRAGHTAQDPSTLPLLTQPLAKKCMGPGSEDLPSVGKSSREAGQKESGQRPAACWALLSRTPVLSDTF